MNYLRKLMSFFFGLMQHKRTLYIHAFFLALGVAIMITGLIFYFRRKEKSTAGIPKKYLALPIGGAILVICETLQIAFYLLMVR